MFDRTRLSMLDEVKASSQSERWQEFFENYGKLVQKWLVEKNVDPADADDIQQETFLAAVQSLPQFEHNGRQGAFRSWLKQILTNRMRRVWEKKASRRVSSRLSELADVLEDDASQLSVDFQLEHDRYVITQLLIRAESKFSKPRVDMFRDLVLGERAVEEVAREHNMTTGAVRVQQHRIMGWLKTFGRGVLDL